MSQSILVSAIFKNNKRICVGLHNPNNNRVANDIEFAHLYNMMKNHIIPKGEKFKRIEIFSYLQDGSKISCLKLDDAISLIKSDTPIK